MSRFWVFVLLLAGAPGCAPSVRQAEFAPSVAEDVMVRVNLRAENMADPAPVGTVAIIPIPLPTGWEKSLRGWVRPPLLMPALLQPTNLETIANACAANPKTVLRMHGGMGGGWERYRDIIQRFAYANETPLVVLTGMGLTHTLSRADGSYGPTSRDFLIVAIMFSGDVEKADCVHEHLGRPVMSESFGDLGCDELRKRGILAGFCP